MTFSDIWYASDDGLRLYAREYPNDRAQLTLLCMPGLTRNSADFSELAREMQPRYRVIAVDQRGRGKSQWDSNTANYTPLRYVADMFNLIEKLQLNNLVPIGTSLGGIMAMMMVNMRPDLFRGVVLNDVGPVISAAGLERIKGYVGKSKPVETWDDAIAESEATNAIAFPHYGRAEWKRWARRIYAENEAGQLQLLYDPEIAGALAASDTNAAPPDTWPLFDGLRNLPVLAFRGALSDILDVDCCAEMQRRHSRMSWFTVPGVGHAPMLNEPGVVSELNGFLAKV